MSRSKYILPLASKWSVQIHDLEDIAKAILTTNPFFEMLQNSKSNQQGDAR